MHLYHKKKSMFDAILLSDFPLVNISICNTEMSSKKMSPQGGATGGVIKIKNGSMNKTTD